MPVGKPLRGFTLPALLVTLAVMALAWAAVGPAWMHQAQRQRERELLRLGLLYAQALAAYRDTLPGSVRSYPMALDELLRDPRLPGVQRHLRRLYPDPLNPRRPWGLVMDDFGRITGVYSQSSDAPLAQGPVVLPDRTLPPAQRYADWKFLASPNR